MRHFLLLLLLLPAVYAITLDFQDIHGNPIQESGIYLRGSREYFSYGSTLRCNFTEPAIVVIDKAATPGKDYAARCPARSGNVTVYPVGTVHGMVVDRLGNIVPHAEIGFACIGYPVLTQQLETDKYGYFTAELPVGSCRINCMKSGATGFADITIAQGDLKDLSIQLNLQQAPITDPKGYGGIVAAALIVFLIIIAFITGKRLIPKKTLSKRSQDILATLNERERMVMTTLIQKGELTQNRIQYATGIPKASLSRIIQKLQTQNLIQVKDYGKTNRISLSDWFSGTE